MSKADDIMDEVLEAIDAHDCSDINAGTLIIAKALADVKEACAKVADEHALAECSNAGGETEAARLCARSIAAAIRDLTLNDEHANVGVTISKGQADETKR